MGFNSIGEGFVLNKSHIDTCARLLLLPQTKFSHSNLCHVPRLGFLFSFSTFMLLNPVKLCKFYHTYLFKSYLRTIDLCNRFVLELEFSLGPALNFAHWSLWTLAFGLLDYKTSCRTGLFLNPWKSITDFLLILDLPTFLWIWKSELHK